MAGASGARTANGLRFALGGYSSHDLKASGFMAYFIK